MSAPETDRLLRAGISAARQGRRAEARRHLEAVVQADQTLEEAWWWLSEVVEDEQERVICLENVLTLNPHHAHARGRLVESGRAGASVLDVSSSLTNYAPVPPLDPVDPTLDDPYQCVYCGHLTEPRDERCPHCGRSLVTLERTKLHRTGWLMTLVVAVVALGLWSGVESFGVMLRLSRTAAPPDTVQSLMDAGLLNPGVFEPESLLANPLMRAVFGNVLGLEYGLARRLFVLAGARLVILVMVALGLYARWTSGYYVALALLLVGLVWDVFQMAMSYTGWLTGLVGLALGLTALLLLFRSEENFPLKMARMEARLHPAATGGAGAFLWGMRYSDQDKHALAVLHFRRAVARSPKNPEYYKRLGLGYARIGRYAFSLRELAEAARLRPDDPDIARILQVVQEMQREAEPGRT